MGVGAGVRADVRVFGSVQSTVPCMQKFWNTPCSPSHSRSLSPVKYFQRVFKVGSMRLKSVLCGARAQQCTCTPF